MPTKIAQDEEQRQLKQLEYEIQYHDNVENLKDNTKKSFQTIINEPRIPKKRGPKKKQMTPSRVARFKVRRIKANGRERERMKGLNEQLEVLRQTIPCFSLSQKLSKIETLRLAKNYIEALTQMISNNQILDNIQFAQLLCKDLSPNTMNLVAATLSINPKIFQLNDSTEFSNNIMTLDDTYILSSMHPRVKNPLEFINLKKTIQTSESEEDDIGIYNMDNISPRNFSEHSSSFSTDFFSNEQQFISQDHSYYYYPTHY